MCRGFSGLIDVRSKNVGDHWVRSAAKLIFSSQALTQSRTIACGVQGTAITNALLVTHVLCACAAPCTLACRLRFRAGCCLVLSAEHVGHTYHTVDGLPACRRLIHIIVCGERPAGCGCAAYLDVYGPCRLCVVLPPNVICHCCSSLATM